MPRVAWLAFAAFVFTAYAAMLAIGCSGPVLPVDIENLGDDSDGGADASPHRDATSPPDATAPDVAPQDGEADSARVQDASDGGERDDESPADAVATSDARVDAPDDAIVVGQDATTDAVEEGVSDGGGASDGTTFDARDDVGDAMPPDVSTDAIDEPLDASSDTSTDGGEAGTYTLGFTISGLEPGDVVTVRDNSAISVNVTSDGNYPLASGLATGTSYDVTATAAGAPTEICNVMDGTGSIGTGSVVVVIICQPAYSITAVVSGLASDQSVTIYNNGVNGTLVSANTSISFPPQANQTTYDVTTSLAEPTSLGLECVVVGGSGTIDGGAVTANVDCGEAVSVTVMGLVSGDSLGLGDVQPPTFDDSRTVTMDGTYMLPLPAPGGLPYDVAVTAQPNNPTETCVITGPTPTGIAMPTINGITATIACGFVITLDVNAFTGNIPVMLTDGVNAIQVTGLGSYPFPALPPSASYDIATVPIDGGAPSCTFSTGASGTLTSNITIDASCP